MSWFRFGVKYDPELWNHETLTDDARNMASCGIDIVYLGEGIWTAIEPESGTLEFDGLDHALEVFSSAGIQIVLCTPTENPPYWMEKKLAEQVMFGSSKLSIGEQSWPGSRFQHVSHVGFRDECTRITSALAKRYGKYPGVCAWQVGVGAARSEVNPALSASAISGFRSWLRARYGTIGHLNEEWATSFRGLNYPDFDDIPHPNRLDERTPPAHHLDFFRFLSDQYFRFSWSQIRAIREHCPQIPIVQPLNFSGFTADPFRNRAEWNILGLENFPLRRFDRDRLIVAERNETSGEFLRQGDPDQQAFRYDLYRQAGNRRFCISSQQVGPDDVGPYRMAPLSGMVRLWTFEAFAHGAELVCFSGWRQHPKAPHSARSALLRSDGAPAPGLSELGQLVNERKLLPNVLIRQASVAMVFDHESAWDWNIQEPADGLSYADMVQTFYRALRTSGLSVDFIPPDAHSLAEWKLIVVVGMARWRHSMLRALEKFRGQVFIGAGCGTKSSSAGSPFQLPPKMDARVSFCIEASETVPPSLALPLTGGGAFRHLREWVEVGDRSEVLDTTQDGSVAYLSEGRYAYLAGWPDELLARRIMADQCQRAGIPLLQLPPDVRIRDCGNLRFVFNYGLETRPVHELCEGRKVVLGSPDLQSAGVLVLGPQT